MQDLGFLLMVAHKFSRTPQGSGDEPRPLNLHRLRTGQNLSLTAPQAWLRLLHGRQRDFRCIRAGNEDNSYQPLDAHSRP